jgi:two-component sensor histidine kinase
LRDDAKSVPRSRLRTRLLAWSAPAALGVLYAQSVAATSEPTVSSWQLMVIALATWYVWVLFTPPIERLSDRWPVRGAGLLRSALVHLLAAVVATLLQACATALATGVVGAAPWSQVPRIVPEWFIVLLPAGTVVYAAVVAFRNVTVTRVRLEQRDRQAEQLALQLRDAQLSALRAQLQPHFLFNTLTAITALVRDHDVERATSALEQLSALLRSALRSDDRHEVPLGEELGRLRHYLHIEELRLGRPITVQSEVSIDAARALVPAWILQPVVENCVRHGFRGRSEPGSLTVRADVTSDRLTMSVSDNGAGLASDWERRVALGHGVSNSRARLAALHGDAATLELSAAMPTGTTARLTLPFRTAA